jgi:hypothetical protein
VNYTYGLPYGPQTAHPSFLSGFGATAASGGTLDATAADAALKAEIAAAGPMEADYLRRTFGVPAPRPAASLPRWIVPVLATAGLAVAAFAMFRR